MYGEDIMKRIGIVVLAVLFVTIGFQTLPALADKTPDELAKETEAACEATAATKPTPQMIMDKVNQACALLQKEGKAGFSKFSGKDSAVCFCRHLYLDTRYGGCDAYAPHQVQDERPGACRF